MLSRFYPLAGTIIDQITIDCDDAGAQFVEARVNCLLSDILQQLDSLLLRNFLPVETESTEAEAGRVLFVHANFFQCGGVVIGLCISHKIADAATISTIVKGWSAAALQSKEAAVEVCFPAASIFPPVDTYIPPMKLVREKYVTRRFVFDASKVAAPKTKAASSMVQQPTRVEAVTALVWKCMMNMSRQIKGYPRLSMLSHSVDLRKKIIPHCRKTPSGTCLSNFQIVPRPSKFDKVGFAPAGLVCKLRKTTREFDENGLQIINVEKRTWQKMCVIDDLVDKDDIDFCTYTSWCKFQLYEADLGWGKLVWASLPNIMLKNLVVFMDTKDGDGVEVLATLSKQEMVVFESDQQLLAFAAFNPTHDDH
ncbi:hypothetical protein Ddye_030361 [Dipteronia dyeriana]|uniref:BAHD acyltransferase n=1 Tax=Dipteronia dyeriana TaxID=168575 RepID=A0AAD9THA2_9ROSI|nr:hypothetical protein Ddye_030361 [Dipteronia dyeriana]